MNNQTTYTNNDTKLEKILWLDLEMTGLNPETDVIIEAGAVITDKNLKELESYHNVIRQDKKYLEAMDSWNQKCHRKSGLYELIPKGKALVDVEQDLLSLLEAHFRLDEKVVVAGNCIYQDRNFIRKYMPRLNQKLHYRMLDITAWKLFFETKGFVFQKANRHRALEDSKESLREFQYYLSCFKLNSNSSSSSGNKKEELAFY